VSGAADNDPSGVVTYLQVGATTGFGLLWLMLLSTPMLYCLEEISTRLGTVTKRGISRTLCVRYGRGVAAAIVLPVIASNVIAIGADFAGTASGVQLVTGIAWEWWVLPVAAVMGYTLVFSSYRTLSRFLLVLTPLFLLYVVAGFVVHPRWDQVLRATLLPSVQFTPTFFEAALGLLGATLTPYMFFGEVFASCRDDHRNIVSTMIMENRVRDVHPRFTSLFRAPVSRPSPVFKRQSDQKKTQAPPLRRGLWQPGEADC